MKKGGPEHPGYNQDDVMRMSVQAQQLLANVLRPDVEETEEVAFERPGRDRFAQPTAMPTDQDVIKLFTPEPAVVSNPRVAGQYDVAPPARQRSRSRPVRTAQPADPSRRWFAFAGVPVLAAIAGAGIHMALADRSTEAPSGQATPVPGSTPEPDQAGDAPPPPPASGQTFSGYELNAQTEDIIVIQAGHINIEQNENEKLRGATGNEGEKEFTQDVASRLVDLLINTGYPAVLVDANFSDPEIQYIYKLVFSVHGDATSNRGNGGFVDASSLAGGKTKRKQEEMKQVVVDTFFPAVGIAYATELNNGISRPNINTQEYYVFRRLVKGTDDFLGTPGLIIECGTMDDSHDRAILDDHEKIAQGLFKALDTLFQREDPDDPSYHIKYSMNDEQKAQRIDEMLAKYGSPMSGKGRKMIELGHLYGIDPAFPLAIAGADSSFATNLTTENNPGNVGNTNSCPNSTAFPTMEQGIEAMYRALDNEYLGKNNLVGEMSSSGLAALGVSGAGRQVWAYGDHSWNQNVSQFLFEFYGLMSPDFYARYKFRTPATRFNQPGKVTGVTC